MTQLARTVKPAETGPIRLEVLRTGRLSPHWMRVTLGGAEIDRFTPMGYDQWFRIFLPLGGPEGLDRIPPKANSLFGYLRYLRIPDGMRPVMRNYTVRAHRPASAAGGAELDVDFVVHGSAADGTAGPASRWAQTCSPGESVVILDEGLSFNPRRGVGRVLLAADEAGLPAVAGICQSLPADAVGLALLEVPTAADVLDFARPDGVEVRWLARNGGEAPGTLALAALRQLSFHDAGPAERHAYVVGEQSLATQARRHLVADRGFEKDRVSFSGYWRVGAASPTPKAQAPGRRAAS